MLESEKADCNGWKYGRTSGGTRDYHLFYGNRNGEVAVSCHYTFATNADSLGVDKTETLVCGSSFYSISLLSGPTLVGFINDSYALELFKNRPLHFLVKPVSQNQIIEVTKKAIQLSNRLYKSFVFNFERNYYKLYYFWLFNV